MIRGALVANPIVRFWQNSLRKIPADERFPFLQEVYFTNLYRARIFSVVLILSHLILIAIDFRLKASGLWITMPGYKYLFYMHVVLEIGLLTFLILFLITKRASADEVKKSDMALLLIFLLFMLVWGAGLSTVDQMINGQITVYLIIILATAVAFYVSGTYSLFLYLAAQAAFIIGISATQPNPHMLLSNYINGSALTVFAWVLSRMIFAARVRQFLNAKTIERQKVEIENAKEKIESILKNILPETIVKQINGAGYPPPDYNPSTTIVFADFVSFYKIAESSDAREVLKILEDMFNAFDETVRRHKLEKLKTIGDCYMFAGGLFMEDNQLVETVEASIEIREIVKRFSAELRTRTGHDWALRIGIHTGPAITGIIGTWRFIYDVWGPTVNIASRLEAASLPNKINVSQQVYDELKKTDGYLLEPRGALAIKNMEAVEMYFVQRKD